MLKTIYVVGESGVGKSAIINRFFGETLLPSYSQGEKVTKFPVQIMHSEDYGDMIHFEIELHDSNQIATAMLETLFLKNHDPVEFQKRMFKLKDFMDKEYFLPEDLIGKNNNVQIPEKVIFYPKYLLNCSQLLEKINVKLSALPKIGILELAKFRKFIAGLDHLLVKTIHLKFSSPQRVAANVNIVEVANMTDFMNSAAEREPAHVILLVGTVTQIISQCSQYFLESGYMTLLNNNFVIVITMLFDSVTTSDFIDFEDVAYTLGMEEILEMKKNTLEIGLEKFFENLFYGTLDKPKLEIPIFFLDNIRDVADDFDELLASLDKLLEN